MESLKAPPPTWAATLQSYEREKRQVVDERLVRNSQVRLSGRTFQVQERSFDPLLQRYRDHNTEVRQRHLEERERISHLNRAQDVQILREQPFHIITHESKLESLAPGADPMRLGGHGTLGERARTKDNRNSFPDTSLDYNLISNIPFEVHHWARPEERPLQRQRSPKSREVPAFTVKDYNIVSNRYLEAHEDKVQRDKQLNLLEATQKHMQRNRFDPVAQQFSDPRHEANSRFCEYTAQVEMQLRAEALLPPSVKGRQTAFYGMLSHEAKDPQTLKLWDTAENERKGRYRTRYNVEQRLHEQELREEQMTEEKRMRKVAPERFEEVRRRGYDIIENKAYGKTHKEKAFHEPHCGQRSSPWERVMESMTSTGHSMTTPVAGASSSRAPAEVLTIKLPLEATQRASSGGRAVDPAAARSRLSGGNLRRSESSGAAYHAAPAVHARVGAPPSAPPAPPVPGGQGGAVFSRPQS